MWLIGIEIIQIGGSCDFLWAFAVEKSPYVSENATPTPISFYSFFHDSYLRVCQNKVHGQNLIGGKNTEKTTGANLVNFFLVEQKPLRKN